MKKKHIVYTLSTIPLTIALCNVNDSNAFFRLDSFITRNRIVSDVVDIKDENLLKAINKQLGRGEILDNVTIGDMESLTNLNASNRNISSVKGLEYATNLVSLNLYNNKIENISTLNNLTNLTYLNLYNNQISNITALRGLTSLTYLHLGDNQIVDILPLENLTSLKDLRLYNNQISDVSILENLTSLTALELYTNQISDISALENLTSLTHLYLGNNQIVDILPLENLTSLTHLYLENNQIVDISALENLTSLKDLRLYNNQISDVSILENLTFLTYLHLGNNQIVDISALENLTSLKELFLYNNQIVDILPLENLTSLKDLRLYNNQISDVSILENLTSLTTLELDTNQISDISALENLTSLTHLHLGNNQIVDILPLENLTSLTYLNLGNNQIVDISAIANLANLTRLEIHSNQISDITVLSNLTNLNVLYLHYNKIFDISSVNNLEKLTHINLGGQRPVLEVGDFKTKTDKLDISINNPIIRLNNKVSNLTNLSNNGVYENGNLKWNNVPLGSHTRTFNFSENVAVGSATATFKGTATLNFNVVDGGAPESDHTSEFDSDDFGIYTTVTANDLGVGVDYLMHKGVRQQLPYRFKYDILEPSNNVVEVYDLVGNKAEYQVKLKDSDIPAIEEGLDALVNKDNSEKEDISYFRKIINDLDESMNKDLLQDRLNSIYPNTLFLDRKSTTSSMDVYIKSENILQMALDTNSITFEDFSGVEDIIRENAVNVLINSSLPYQLNAYLPTEIQNADKTNIMDKSILNIKENGESNYQVFANTTDKIVLKDNCSAGNDLVHGVDIKLVGGIAHEKDVYKTTIKFEAEQK